MQDQQKQVPQNANQHCPGVGSSKAGKSQSCQGCPNQGACSSGQLKVDPAIQIIKQKLKNVKHKILILSGKGGVGKSTVATQLAMKLSQNYQVGLLDVDICGPSVPTILGLVGSDVHQSSQGWSPVYCGDLAVMSIGFLLHNQNEAVVWRGPRKNGLIKQFLQDVNWGDLDFLIIDTPPGTSDEHLSLAQYLSCTAQDGAIVVSTPQEVALADVRKQLNFCSKTNIPLIGMVENMSGFVCPNCKCSTAIFSPTSGGVTKLCQQYKCKLLVKIPLDPKSQQMMDKGQSIFEEKKQEKQHNEQTHQQPSIMKKCYIQLEQSLIKHFEK